MSKQVKILVTLKSRVDTVWPFEWKIDKATAAERKRIKLKFKYCSNPGLRPRNSNG